MRIQTCLLIIWVMHAYCTYNSFQGAEFKWPDVSVKCQDFSAKGSKYEHHFGVEWFENAHNFWVVGTRYRNPWGTNLHEIRYSEYLLPVEYCYCLPSRWNRVCIKRLRAEWIDYVYDTSTCTSSSIAFLRQCTTSNLVLSCTTTFRQSSKSVSWRV